VTIRSEPVHNRDHDHAAELVDNYTAI